MATTPDTTTPAKPPARKGQRTRIAGAAGAGALIVLFAVLNLGDVKVNWLFGTWSTPLIIVIIICFAAGMAVDRVLVRRARKR